MDYDEATALRLVRNAVRCYNERLRTYRWHKISPPRKDEHLEWVSDIEVNGWIGLGVRLVTDLMQDGDPFEHRDLTQPPNYTGVRFCVRISDHTGHRKAVVGFHGHHALGLRLEITDDQIRAMLRGLVGQAVEAEPQKEG